MNSQEFYSRLSYIQESLFAHGFLKNVKEHNFAASDLAQIQIQLAQVASQTALGLQELDLKKQQVGVEVERTRQELEMAIVQSRLANLKATADAITSCVQAESIKRSVVDNAAINKANAFIQHYNVSMNAIANNSTNLNEGGTLKKISDLVISIIEKINDEPLKVGFDEVIDEMLNKALELKNLGTGKSQVSIIAPKTTLAPDEPLTLFGVSAFGDNACEFVLGAGESQVIEPSKFYIFRSKELGKHKVIFRAKNDKDKWVKSQITLSVIAQESETKCKRSNHARP